MLFTYRYVPHRIEKFQEYLDHLVKKVWCTAKGHFSVDLLDDDLRNIVMAIANDNHTRLKLFEPIRDIFDSFKELSPEYRSQIAEWYDANNNIEALCSNAPDVSPGTYDDVELIHEDLAKQLRSFCIALWERVMGLSSVQARIGDIDDHYRAFVETNDEGKCPFCGLAGIKGQYHTKREAYDHYLPKDIYPFNSVNFKNLAPICHECNSSYKLRLDPTRHIDPITRKNRGGRRKSFYAYGTVHPKIEITIHLSTRALAALQADHITLQITSPGRTEEVEAWKEVFGIEERYRAHCCQKNDGKAWLNRILSECQNYGLTPRAMLDAEIRSANATPWSDANFLKTAFLLACQEAGLI
jgi:hypothetical protein